MDVFDRALQSDLLAATVTDFEFTAPETIDRFTDDLRSSGFNLFDAENLRSLFSEYERQTVG